MTDHLLWKSEPFSKGQAWIDLLMHANFSDNEILIKGQVIRLSRGQQARSEVTLSKSWKWSRNKVRRFLELLKKEGMIVTETTHLTSIISICNYESFQDGDTAGGTSVGTSVGTAGGHLTEHSKECKEREEGKEGKEVPKSKYKYSDDDLKCAEYIYSLVLKVTPNMRKPNLQSWANTVRLMIESDNRSHKEICQVMQWANSDQFWSSNILSASKLRDKFDGLQAKMNSITTIQPRMVSKVTEQNLINLEGWENE